jgi:hypothetical protein
VIAVVIVLVMVKTTDDLLLVNMMPLSTIKPLLLIVAAVLFGLGLLAYSVYVKRKKALKPIASLYRLYVLMFIPYALIVVYAGLFYLLFLTPIKTFMRSIILPMK